MNAEAPCEIFIKQKEAAMPLLFFRRMKVFAPPDRIPYERASKELIRLNIHERSVYLVETYSDAILRLSYTYLKNTQDAQDICQTVFVKLLTEPKTFESPQHERSYILQMAANACKDLLKSPWRKRTCDLDACAQIPAPESGDSSLLAAVNELPAHYRAVIYLFYYEGYQAAEIGEILGVPTATVHTRLARGRAKLKDILGGYGYEQTV